MKRYGMVIHLKPEKVADYIELHRAVWPDVLAILSRHFVKNYSIFLKENLLFGYLEYHGDNYALDMQQVADYEVTKRWWELTAPCQQPLTAAAEGEWWTLMQEVFHLE